MSRGSVLCPGICGRISPKDSNSITTCIVIENLPRDTFHRTKINVQSVPSESHIIISTIVVYQKHRRTRSDTKHSRKFNCSRCIRKYYIRRIQFVMHAIFFNFFFVFSHCHLYTRVTHILYARTLLKRIRGY